MNRSMLQHLHARADLLQRLRRFFVERGFLEVDTPIASVEVIPERHIELFQSSDGGYLQASPEMSMKRLLCGGSGPIFQVARVFRAEERGTLHASEFTMVEWYRPGEDMAAGMDLLDELIQATLGTPPCRRTSYREAFQQHAGVDPFVGSTVRTAAEELALLDGPHSGPDETDELLNLLLATVVEPQLGADRPELLYHYPATQCALATTTTDKQGHAVAERFELYYRGVELANGYRELTDAEELRRRLALVNQQRIADGRATLPMPEALLADMRSPGLPASAGVALGFDRLLMLALGASTIEEVMVS